MGLQEKTQFYFKEEGLLAEPTVISELLANPALMSSLWFAPREGNSNGLVVVVKAVVTRSKPKKISSRCKKLENNIFVVTHSDFAVLRFFESRRSQRATRVTII